MRLGTGGARCGVGVVAGAVSERDTLYGSPKVSMYFTGSPCAEKNMWGAEASSKRSQLALMSLAIDRT